MTLDIRAVSGGRKRRHVHLHLSAQVFKGVGNSFERAIRGHCQATRSFDKHRLTHFFPSHRWAVRDTDSQQVHTSQGESFRVYYCATSAAWTLSS